MNEINYRINDNKPGHISIKGIFKMILLTLFILFLKLFVVGAITYSNCQMGNACLLEMAIGRAVSGSNKFLQGGTFTCLEKFGNQGFMRCLLNSAKTIIEAQYVGYFTSCTNCEKQTLEKLNDALEHYKIALYIPDRSELQDHLENEGRWFSSQSPAWKKVLVNQAMARLAQKDLSMGIDTMITKTKEIIFGTSDSGHMNADILTGDIKGIVSPKATIKLLEIQSLFEDMEKSYLGQIYPTDNSKKFFCTVLGKSSESHVEQLINDLTKRLSQGRSESGSYKEVKACDLRVHHFSGLLIFGSFVLWRVALAMQGEDMDSSDSRDFISTFRTLHTGFDIACSCSKNQIEVYQGWWRTRWHQQCYQVFYVNECTDRNFFIRRGSGCDFMCLTQQRARGFPSPQSREEDTVIWEKEASKCNAPVLLSAISDSIVGKGIVWRDRSVVNYTNWAWGQPSPREGCVYYVTGSGTWRTEDCMTKIGDSDGYFCVLCERRVPKMIEELPEMQLGNPHHTEEPAPAGTLICDNNGKVGPGKRGNVTNQGPGKGGHSLCSAITSFTIGHFLGWISLEFWKCVLWKCAFNS